MQLLFSASEENDTRTLGLFEGTVTRFAEDGTKTIPHMGWNSVVMTKDHPLLHGLAYGTHFYFVHSYYAPVGPGTAGQCSYGEDFTAIAAAGNFMGCQFHPERSGMAGQKILRNFLEIKV
jgi:glutamine amidotransferase